LQAKQLHTVADHLHKRINAQDKMIQVHAFVADLLCGCLHAWCGLLTCSSDSVQQLHNDIDTMSRDKKKAIAKYQKVR